MRKEGKVVSFKLLRPVLKLSNQFVGRLSPHIHRLRYIEVTRYSSKISRVVERVIVPGTVSGRLRSSALHV